ncbi:MAG: methyltransferase [Deltaproteobacteria bacterium]|nr:methyltransferase [Deltaproteobacteria bacterium]
MRTEAELLEVLASPGYTPARAEVPALLELLGSGDERSAEKIARVLARLGAEVEDLALARFSEATPPLRARLCELVGRLARGAEGSSLSDWLVLRLEDADAVTRRRAAVALGKVGLSSAEPALLAAWTRTQELPEQRVLAAALGKVGGEAALTLLRSTRSDDPELARIVTEARMKLERTALRQAPGSIDPAAAPKEPVPVLLHVRAGLEALLVDELPPSFEAREVGRGRVRVKLGVPLARLFQSRLFLHFGFPLPPELIDGAGEPGPDALAEAVVRALTSYSASQVFHTFTRGLVRYRLEWAGAGHRRALTYRVAQAVSRERPQLVNDPREALWEVVVSLRSLDEGTRVSVELWPCGLEDPRFTYRKRLLPAASHPTIAAALARVAGLGREDVAWDPFVGTGSELVERARLGPYVKLFGTDRDPAAVAAAGENLVAAGLERWSLAQGDARLVMPEGPLTLVITNPPLGRRLLDRREAGMLLAEVITRVAPRLAPGGRIVLVSPDPSATAPAARAAGLRLAGRFTVDMGGFEAELERFDAPAARTEKPRTRRDQDEPDRARRTGARRPLEARAPREQHGAAMERPARQGPNRGGRHAEADAGRQPGRAPRPGGTAGRGTRRVHGDEPRVSERRPPGGGRRPRGRGD